jgi:hypothetical protein
MWNLLAEKGGRPDPTLEDFMKTAEARTSANEAETRAEAFVAKPVPDPQPLD